MEEQPANKIIQVRHPLIFAAGCVTFVLYIAYLDYEWLLLKEAISGPELRTSFALSGLMLPMLSLSSVDMKHRWMKIVPLILGLALAGLLAAGVVDMFRPFPEQAMNILVKLSVAITFLFIVYTVIISLVYPQPYEKKKLSRREKIKTAIIIVLAIAGILTLWFGGRQLAYWLLTRG